MSIKPADFWDELKRAQVVTGDAPAFDAVDSPWYVRALLGFSGWLAAIFVLFFVGLGLSSLLDSAVASFILGTILIGIAFALLRTTEGDFVEQVALATSFAGQGLVAYAAFKSGGWSSAGAWALIGLMHVVLAVVMPNFIHRVLSALFCAMSFQYASTYAGIPYLFGGLMMIPVAWIWLNEFSYPTFLQPLRAIGYGLVLGLVNIKASAMFGSNWWMHRRAEQTWVQPWMDEVIAGAAILFVVWQILRRNGFEPTSRVALAAFAATVLAVAASLEAHGLTAGVMIMLLGFAGGNRVLVGLGIASVLFYVSRYYYMTDTSLLVKSYTMALVGVVLLGLRLAMRYVVPGDKEGDDA